MTRSGSSAKAAGARFERIIAYHLAKLIDDRIDRRVKTGAKDRHPMSAGMADTIATHTPIGLYEAPEEEPDTAYCQCGSEVEALGKASELYAAHVAEELTKAGYGNIPDSLREAAGQMPIETLAGADKASIWLRTRAGFLDMAAANLSAAAAVAAALNDPEGHALVQAIHDRKA